MGACLFRFVGGGAAGGERPLKGAERNLILSVLWWSGQLHCLAPCGVFVLRLDLAVFVASDLMYSPVWPPEVWD